MNASVLKFAPTAVILVAAVGSAWPYLGESESAPATPAPAEKVALPEIAPLLLKPLKLPRPLRDPFLDPEIYRIEARKKITQALKSLIKPLPDPRTVRAVAKTSPKAKAAKIATLDRLETDPREGMVLSATSTHPKRGSAVINGHVYLTGELIASANLVEPCVLAEVRPNQAVLKYRDKTYPLGYPSLASTTTGNGAPVASRPPARRVGARRGGSPRN